jgi:predicted  nucleic acid-binding Zn-ribbon protein
MSAVDLKSQIANLVKLQKIDAEIYALKEERVLKPDELKVLESSFAIKKVHLGELEKSSLELQKKRKEEELALAVNEENQKKLQSQLYALKTNKEYQTMLQEIKDAKADASLIEDKILQNLEEGDRLKAEVEKEKTLLAREEMLFVREKKKIEERLNEIADRLAQLEAQRKQVIPAIELKVLAQYERILNNRDGLAIVGVKDNSCQGCNMLVPPQVINLVKMYERLITCEVCNRILYVQAEVEISSDLG